MKITLYKKSGCPWSAAVIGFLNELSVPFEIRNVTTHPQYAAEVEKKSGIRAAFQARCDLPNLLLDPNISNKVMDHQENLRSLVCAASQLGIPVPGLMVSLGYLDAYRSAWMPANLIQAQRDYFGSHTYERVDAKGVFHTQWSPA